MLVFLLAALENDEDKKLFTEIYEQYRPQMERTAMHFLKSHADVEDAVQNAFMQMIRHFEKIYEIPCEELSFWATCKIYRKKNLNGSTCDIFLCSNGRKE